MSSNTNAIESSQIRNGKAQVNEYGMLRLRVVFLIRPGWIDLFNKVLGSNFSSGYNHNNAASATNISISPPPPIVSGSMASSVSPGIGTDTSNHSTASSASSSKDDMKSCGNSINELFSKVFLNKLFSEDVEESKYNNVFVESIQVATRKSSTIYSVNPSFGGFHIDVIDDSDKSVNGESINEASNGNSVQSTASASASTSSPRKPKLNGSSNVSSLSSSASSSPKDKKSGNKKYNQHLKKSQLDDVKPKDRRYIADISRELWYLESKYQLAKWCSTLPPSESPCSESWCVPWNSVPPDSDDEDSDDDELINEKGMATVTRLGEMLDSKKVRKLVLKLDGASGGKGVFFVQSGSELMKQLRDYRISQEALPFAHERRNFTPNWAIQQYIHPPMLICGNRKFTIRVFSVILGNTSFIHPVYEVRAAPQEYDINDIDNDREADITNGGGVAAMHDRRYLAKDIPELAPILGNIHDFVAKFTNPTKGRPVPSEEDHWKERHKDTDEYSDSVVDFRKEMIDQMGGVSAAVVAHDVMVDQNGKLYLLETNHSPAAPPDELEGVFGEHLNELIIDFVRILLWGALNNDRTYTKSKPPSPWLLM